MINTRFWSDTYISNLDPLEKLLFLYFITNPYTNICGIYEIPLKQIALDTGIDRENLEKVFLPRFQEAQKIYYIDGWIYIKNFLKHQKASGNIQLGIENGLKDVPKPIMAKIKELSDTPPTQGGHSPKSEYESESESKDATPSVAGNEVNTIINLFKSVNPSYKKLFSNKTQRSAVERMLKEHGVEKLKWVLNVLPKTNLQKYMPMITTPNQLEDKLATLIFNLKKESSKGIQTL